MASAAALLEREPELELLTARARRAADGEGGIVLVEAVAGRGKSALLRALRAQTDALRTLVAVGGELERDFPFGVVRQLLEPVVFAATADERAQLLSGAGALAGPVLGLADSDGTIAVDADHAVLHGLYWLLATLAEREPLLLIVDDAHWADAPSLRFLDFLARRAPELPLLVVVAMRPREPGAEHELLARLADAPQAETLTPAELSAGAVAELVTGLGIEADDAALAAAHETTGGNPLLLRELVRTLAAQSEPATAESVRSAVPASVSRSVGRRLARLSDAERSVAQNLAILGDRRNADVLGALAGLDAAAEAGALLALRDADIVDGDPPRFVHPLVRAAVADAIAPSHALAQHARAAALLRDVPGRDEDVVLQLMAAPPIGEPWAVAALRDAAARAGSEGAHDAAVRRLQRALAEPLSDGERDVLLLELGRAEARAGRAEAMATLGRATAAADPHVAAEAYEARAGLAAMMGDAGASAAAADLDAALASLGESGHAATRARVRGQQLHALMLAPSLSAKRREIVDGLEDDPPVEVLQLLTAELMGREAPRDELLALYERAVVPLTDAALIDGVTALWPTYSMVVYDEAERSRALLAEGEATARRSGSRFAIGVMDINLTLWLVLYGELALVEGVVREAGAYYREVGITAQTGALSSALVEALVLQGELDAAERELADVPPEAWRSSTMLPTLHGARARLRLAQGRPEAAVEDLLAVQAQAEGYGWRAWPRMGDGCDLALAFARCGRREEAQARAREELAAAERTGVATQRARALVALSAALDGDASDAAAAQAAEAGRASPSAVARARALLAHGAALRRSGARVAARDVLREALDAAASVGARGLEAQIGEELLVAGARPRRTALRGIDALTPAERRVAELAARGLSNREIAETLFVTRKTVELHLGNAYGKLDIKSRTQLADLLP